MSRSLEMLGRLLALAAVALWCATDSWHLALHPEHAEQHCAHACGAAGDGWQSAHEDATHEDHGPCAACAVAACAVTVPAPAAGLSQPLLAEAVIAAPPIVLVASVFSSFSGRAPPVFSHA